MVRFRSLGRVSDRLLLAEHRATAVSDHVRANARRAAAAAAAPRAQFVAVRVAAPDQGRQMDKAVRHGQRRRPRRRLEPRRRCRLGNVLRRERGAQQYRAARQDRAGTGAPLSRPIREYTFSKNCFSIVLI
jgi:hypothetical protein